MNSFRSRPLGWRYESARHSLAAKGIRTRYFAKARSQEERGSEDLPQYTAKELEAREKSGVMKERERRRRIEERAEKARALSTGPGTLRAGEAGERMTVEEVLKRRPFNLAVDQVRKGNFEGKIPIINRQTGEIIFDKPIDDLLDPLDTMLNEQEKSALRSEIGAAAVKALRDTPGLTKGRFGAETRKILDEMTKGKEGKQLKREISAVEKQRDIEARTPFGIAARRYGEEKALAAFEGAQALPGEAVGLVGSAAKGAIGLTGAGLEEIEEARPSYSKDIKEFPKLIKNIETLESDSPFFTVNAVIGDEEQKDSPFKFMGNLKEGEIKGVKGDIPGGKFEDFWDGLVGVDLSKESLGSSSIPGIKGGPATKVKKEVDSVYGAKEKIAKVDLTPFEDGTRAFKEGKRGSVVDALVRLEAEEQKLKDRYALVEKTRQKMLTPENQDALFSGESDSLIFGKSGGSKIAEETEKIAKVKAELSESANKVADRKFILRHRLERLDAQVAPEAGAPRKVEVVGEEKKRNVMDKIKESHFFEDLTGGNF
jgi:hypothetical protein